MKYLRFGSSRLMTWAKRLLVATCILALVLAAGMAYGWRAIKKADARHAAFCECGTDIKGFLKQYAKATREAIESQDASSLRQFYAADYSSPSRGTWSLSNRQDLGDAHVLTLVRDGDSSCDGEAIVQELDNYVSGIESVEHVKCKIGLIEEIEPDVSATLTVKYVLDGRDLDGNLFQDRFFFRWGLRRNDATDLRWEIVGDELVEGVRAAGKGDSFARVAAADLGIDYVHQRNPKLDKHTVPLKFAVIEHAAGGVSAVDYDEDGRTDLFFSDGVDSRLYRNVGPRGEQSVAFDDVTEAAGLSGIGAAHSALFADLDNDGDKDCFISRYLSPSKLFRNEGGKFVDATADFGFDLVAPCVSACLLDYDGDSYLDLYVAVNGNAPVAAPDIPFYATNAEENRLFHNVGGKSLVDVTEASGTGSTGWTLAVTSGDYDNDGLPDIAVANDFGRKVLYRNNGDGTFTDVAKDAGVLDFSGGMGVAFGDLNGDEYPDFMTSNIESGQRWFGEEITLWQYMRNVIRTRWLLDELPEYNELHSLLGDGWRELGKQVGEGNSVFCNQQDGTFVEWKDCNATRAGWAWSVNPLDYDNDGDLDIHVANGWISGKLKDDL